MFLASYLFSLGMGMKNGDLKNTTKGRLYCEIFFVPPQTLMVQIFCHLGARRQNVFSLCSLSLGVRGPVHTNIVRDEVLSGALSFSLLVQRYLIYDSDTCSLKWDVLLH